jgi:tetratricopeptide (TPR) repeat protein
VQIHQGGFDSPSTVRLGATDNLGRIRTPEVFAHVAFVGLKYGGKVTQAPVPLLDDQPIEFRLIGTQDAEKYAEFEYFHRLWVRRYGENIALLEEKYNETKRLAGEGRREDAIKEAENLANTLRKEVEGLQQELEKLKEIGKDAGATAAGQVKTAQDLLTKQLENNVKLLDQFVQDERNPSPARQAYNRAVLHYTNGAIDDAIKGLDEALRVDPNQAEWRKFRDRLVRVWRNNDEELKQARDLIMNKWPKLSWQALDSEIPNVEKALDVLEKHGDFLTAAKLLKTVNEHLTNLNNVANTLNAQTDQNDEEKRQLIEKLAENLRKLSRRAVDIVDRFENS